MSFSEWSFNSIEDVTKRVKVGFVGTCEKFYCSKIDGIPMIRTTNLKEDGIDYSDLKYVTREFHEMNKKSQLHKDDILVARHGDNGKACLFKNDIEANCLNVIVIEPDASILIPRFLKYLFDSPKVKDQVSGAVVGTVQNVVNTKTIAKVKISIPPLPEQKAIADTLSCLDDKIELNNRINKTLEEMAQAIFKSWFVDFEPFQDGEFEDSELGRIPKGWHIFNLSEIFEINPSRRIPRGTIAPYLDMSNVPTRGHAPNNWIEREIGSGMKFINGDTLVARITPCLENGKTAYVDFLEDGQVGWGSTEYIILRPRSPISTVFAYILARSDRFRDYAIKRMTGSSGRQRVPADNIGLFKIVLPPLEHVISKRFAVIIESLFNSMRISAQESRTLNQIRDSLLPKLMSGEIRVPLEEVQ